MSLRFSNFYRTKTGDNLSDPLFWNTRFEDLDLRLNLAESLVGKIDTAVQEIIAVGINRIDTTYQPLLDNLAQQVNALSAQLSQLIVNIGEQEAAATATLNSMIEAAQGFIDELQTLGDIDGGTF